MAYSNYNMEITMVYDVAVIGAGPAGSTLSKRLASNNRKVLLIDAQNDSSKKPCGGLLAPDAQKELAHFDLVLTKKILVDPQNF